MARWLPFQDAEATNIYYSKCKLVKFLIAMCENCQYVYTIDVWFQFL